MRWWRGTWMCWFLLTIGVVGVGPAVAKSGGGGSGPANYYVASNGNDAWSGTFAAPNATNTDGPFATLEAAQNAIRKLKSTYAVPKGGVTVWLRGGTYYRTATFSLTSADSGASSTPITYRAYGTETVRITGGKAVTGFTPVTDPNVLGRLPAAAQPNVVQANLPAQGITDFGQYQVRGSYDPTRMAALELFFLDQPMTLARWPNPGSWATITSVPGGANGATIGYAGNEPAQWSNVQDSWLHGFWTWNWADSYVNVTSIDTVNRVITTASPYAGAYGYSVGGRFYAQNILEELDRPGEWYLNRQTGNLYFWPPSPLTGGQVTASLLNAPLVALNAASYISFNGLIFECARGTGITITGGSYNSIVNSTVRNMGNYAIDIEGGSNQGVTNCLITGDGDGGIIVNGSALYANNNEIAHYARWVYSYQAGIHVESTGAEISHNKIYDAPHNAILLDGSSQTLEYNEIFQVCLQTQDAGAIYTGSSGPNTIRYNFIHDLGLGGINNSQYSATAAVYLDNAASRATIFGNVIANGNVGVLVSGGSRDSIQNNIITNCPVTVHVDIRTGSPRFDTITTNVLYLGNFEFWNNVQQYLTINNNLLNIDPLFVDPTHNNYQLQSTSPAYKQINNFQAIPFSQIGRQ